MEVVTLGARSFQRPRSRLSVKRISGSRHNTVAAGMNWPLDKHLKEKYK